MRILLVIKGDVGCADLPEHIYNKVVVLDRSFRQQHDETFMIVECPQHVEIPIMEWFGSRETKPALLFFNKL